MASSMATESTPLVPSPPMPNEVSSRAQRTVTFNPQTTISHPNSSGAITSSLRVAPASSTSVSSAPTFQHGSTGQPMLSALNSKLRRNSQGSPLSAPPMLHPASKIGPQRTTKNAQKLKLLPNPDPGDDGPDEESGRDVYSQFTRIKDPTARRDAARLGKADRDKLPRVTAYCTASSYRLDVLLKFLKGRSRTRGANPKQFDECIYSPYNYGRSKSDRKPSISDSDGGVVDLEDASNPPLLRERRHSDSEVEVDMNKHQHIEELIDLHTEAGDTSLDNGESSIPNHSASEMEQPQTPRADTLDFDTQVHTPEVFLFEYGTVVIWGMTLQQEQRFLKEISKFENEKLSSDDVQTENFNFYYTREYQARIYNDFISLREKKNYMTKLAISHALSQSVKVNHLHSPFFPFPRLVSNNTPPDLPLRRPCLHNHINHNTSPRTDRPNRLHRPDPTANHNANRPIIHPAHQHPSSRFRARLPRTHVGRTTTRTCIRGCQELSGDGSESGVADGEVGCYCGFVGGAQGSGRYETWGVSGVDWYIPSSTQRSRNATKNY